MKHCLTLAMTLATFASVNPAFADEEFTGVYIGGSSNFMTSRFADSGVDFDEEATSFGVFAGGSLEYKDLIVGLEVDFQNTKDLSQAIGSITYTIDQNIDLNLRVGYVARETLFYVSGGLSEAILDIAIPGQGGSGTISGANVGLGFERATSNGYLWGVDFRRRNYTENETITSFVDDPMLSSVSFRFGKRF